MLKNILRRYVLRLVSKDRAYGYGLSLKLEDKF
jgi:DNA-binding PadR family transcriptional regulator